jgi:hypothetical protein
MSYLRWDVVAVLAVIVGVVVTWIHVLRAARGPKPDPRAAQLEAKRAAATRATRPASRFGGAGATGLADKRR